MSSLPVSTRTSKNHGAYLSHQFSVSIETELSDSGDIQGEASRIYDLLQDAVDREIQQTGFIPGETYGLAEQSSVSQNGDGSTIRTRNANSNGNGKVRWSCSDKQKVFFGKIIVENDLDPKIVEEIAFHRFGVGSRKLNKLPASGLFSEFLIFAENSKDSRNQASASFERHFDANRGNGSFSSKGTPYPRPHAGDPDPGTSITEREEAACRGTRPLRSPAPHSAGPG